MQIEFSFEVLGRFDGRDVRACELGPGDVMGELEFVSEAGQYIKIIRGISNRIQILLSIFR